MNQQKSFLEQAIEAMSKDDPRLAALKDVAENPITLRHIGPKDEGWEKANRLIMTTPDLIDDPERVLQTFSLFESEDHLLLHMEGPGYFKLAIVNTSTFKFGFIVNKTPFHVLTPTGEVLIEGGFKRIMLTRTDENVIGFAFTTYMDVEPPNIS